MGNQPPVHNKEKCSKTALTTGMTEYRVCRKFLHAGNGIQYWKCSNKTFEVNQALNWINRKHWKEPSTPLWNQAQEEGSYVLVHTGCKDCTSSLLNGKVEFED